MNAPQRTRATYAFQPVDRLVRREFYIWPEAIQRWKTEGMAHDADPGELFGWDPPAEVGVGNLGWTAPPLVPAFDSEVIESADDYEIVRDDAGRLVKCFQGKRHGFMPTYLKHAVTGDDDWQRDVAPRLAVDTPGRMQAVDETVAQRAEDVAAGRVLLLNGIGGYMYLRSLVGPEEICYLFLDNPDLVHRMMQAWLELFDAVAARAQRTLAIDGVFLAEDIAYNHGLLISPEMVREFLFPYYRQLLDNVRRRQQPDVMLMVDTDGNCDEAIPLHREIGLHVMCPFEVAAGNDVVAQGRQYPDLVLTGGIDKRVLAAGPDAIDRHLEAIVPAMVRRGGYIPTCDHGVPDDVSFANYMHYRKRMMEIDH